MLILSYQMNVAKISGRDKDLALWAAPARAQAVRQLGGPGLAWDQASLSHPQ